MAEKAVAVESAETEQVSDSTAEPPYKVFKDETEYNSFVESQKKSIKSSLERSLRTKFQKEAEMTAEQKTNEKIKGLEEENRALLVSKNRSIAQSELISNGLDLKNHADIVDFVATDDEATSLSRAKLLSEFVLYNAKLISDREKKQTMVSVAKPHEVENSKSKPDESIAQRLGKCRANIFKAVQATIQNYL